MNNWHVIFVETGWEDEVVRSIRWSIEYMDKQVDYHVIAPKEG